MKEGEKCTERVSDGHGNVQDGFGSISECLEVFWKCPGVPQLFFEGIGKVLKASKIFLNERTNAETNTDERCNRVPDMLELASINARIALMLKPTIQKARTSHNICCHG